MDGVASDRHILDWDETDVHNWFSSLGYPQYENQIREHKVKGDTLCHIKPEDLKSLGITTIGQRLSILKAIYQVKLAHNIPMDESHYVPPSEAPERVENINMDRLHSIVKDQAQRLRTLEEENRSLTGTLQSFMEEFNSLRSSSSGQTDDSPSSIRRQPSFKWAQFVKPQKSPTKADIESPHPSPLRLEHNTPSVAQPAGPSTFTEKTRATVSNIPPPPETPTLSAPKPMKQESSDNLKSFKVSLEDPTWKVLPAALKKYRINNDNWQSYAMFICYGPSGNRIERCLSYDEKPLLLFQKLKDAKKNPVFMLKHMKDIRSPIAVAQQKHAARKASSIISQESSFTTATHGHQRAASTARNLHRPPKLEVQDLSASTPIASTGLSPQPGWPDNNMLSPAVDASRQDTPASATTQVSYTGPVNSMGAGSGATLAVQTFNAQIGHRTKSAGDSSEPSTGGGVSAREMPPASSSGVSYAVAIYPYMAEQDDEFDVVVGDTFVILSRARGWWVVQRDPTGSGVVDTDIVKQGWVPAGCLLETNVPVASAIAEATAAKNGSLSGSSPDSAVSKTPILPLSIISTSFPGIALMDYKKKGEEELDLVKDDALRVFKRYNHWSYAVKEVGGDRGWVPSWFIGKVSPLGTGGLPATPGPTAPFSSMTPGPEDGQGQVSPMSSAFPPSQSRTAIVI